MSQLFRATSVGQSLLWALLALGLVGPGCATGAPREPGEGRGAVAAAAADPLARLQQEAPPERFVFDDPAQVVVPPGQARDRRDEIIYFVMTDRFFNGDPSNDRNVIAGDKGAFHGGDLAGLQRKLGYLSQLGVTALWITPVVQQIDHAVTGAGFPDWGYHGYWAEDFTRIEPRLGREEELTRFVRASHSLGMQVLIDVVLNHPGYGSHFVQDAKMVRSTELSSCAETDDDLKKCLSGLPDFRTEDPAVAEQLIQWQVEWVSRSGCDGFRVDTVKHVEHEVWKEFSKRVKQLRPDFFLLGEVWGATMHEDYASEYMGDQMDTLFDFGFHGEVEGFLLGRGRPVAFSRYLERRHRYTERLPLAHYLDSHDVPSMLFRLGGDKKKMALAALLQLTSYGIPVITWGNEVGRVGGDWPVNRTDMLWGEAQDGTLLASYRKLVQLRRQHRSLSRGSYTPLQAGDDVLAFLRMGTGAAAAPGTDDPVIVAINRGATDAVLQFQLPPGAAEVARWQDLYAGDGRPIVADAGKLMLALAPGRALILAPLAGK